jgi:hypothetical protein
MSEVFDWGPVLEAARRGDLPLIRVGASPALVVKEFGGRQPVYLATPYSREVTDSLGAWCHERSRALGRAAALAAEELRQLGVSAFAPIALSDAMVRATGAFVAGDFAGVRFALNADPLDAGAWARWCQPFLNTCGALVIPDIAGWDRSDGIAAELRFALHRGLPVFVYAGAGS